MGGENIKKHTEADFLWLLRWVSESSSYLACKIASLIGSA